MLSMRLLSYDSVRDLRKWSNLNMDSTLIFSFTSDMFLRPSL